MSEKLMLASFAEAATLAKSMVRCTLLPAALKGKEADVHYAMLAGRELGIGPIASLRAFHVIEGKPTLSADTMAAVALASDVCEYFIDIESSPKRATYETKRRGAPRPQRMSFSIEEARDAGLLGKDNWKRYTAAMLRARAKSALARNAYPDLLAGIYSTEEAQDFALSGPVIDAEVVEGPPLQSEEIGDTMVAELEASIAHAQGGGLEALKILADRLHQLPPGPARDRLQLAYRKAWVSARDASVKSSSLSGSLPPGVPSMNGRIPRGPEVPTRYRSEHAPGEEMEPHPPHDEPLPNMDDGDWGSSPAGGA